MHYSKLGILLLSAILISCNGSDEPEPTPEPDPVSTTGVCPQNEACRILAIGDSITQGMMLNVNTDEYELTSGYRLPLFTKSIISNKNIAFVGRPSEGGPLSFTMDNKLHYFPKGSEGHPGWTMKDIESILPMPALQDDPHIVLLHIGTQDLVTFSEVPDMILDATNVINAIKKSPSNPLILVSTIIPNSFSGISREDYRQEFNYLLPELVESLREGSKYKIEVVDLDALLKAEIIDFDRSSVLSDHMHPNKRGYALMTKGWYEAMKKHLN